ncbi:MAG: transporter, partial [Verrucomicrobia bacterium]|nr:transporter [Verrucomicrobiota bacterium]
TVQSLWLSPKMPTSSGWILGAGPVFLLPTATDDLLGTEKWGTGPTAVALKQSGPWTYGGLANHIWSFAGNDRRADVSTTFCQPFVTYQLGQGRSVSFTSESTYDWENSQWTVPLILMYSKVAKIGSQMVSFSAGAKYYADKPDGGPDWGLRVAITLLFPK